MTEAEILSHSPVVLTHQQRAAYFAQGYLLVEEFVSRAWLARLLDTTQQMVDRARSLRKSDAIFDLEPGHTAESPRLRRLTNPVGNHQVYWEFASESPIIDLVADLVGPDVKFHHSKLNFKWARGGEEVKWHQDVTYWPHTNYTPLTVGLYLHDVGADQGPLGVIPGSHHGDLFSQYGADGNWTGHLNDADLASVGVEKAAYLEGPAGSVTIHNCRAIHGSRPNQSDQGRPLLLNAYSSADAFTYTHNPIPSRQAGMIVRGRPAQAAHHDPRPCPIPPDWSAGYTSLFALQQGEQWDAEQQSTVAEQTASLRTPDRQHH